MQQTEILIVGGGPAGLSAGGALKHAGLNAVILDKADRVGASWFGRYDRLHLHTERNFSGLAHLKIPNAYGKYVAKDEFANYLQAYAKHFDLDWRGNSPVQRVRIESNGNGSEFIVESANETWTSRKVIIATGQYGVPVLPDFPGASEYKGHLMHSANYKTGREFAGKRVLVIGSGNSGAEIAVDLVEQGAAYVALAIRTMPPVVPRDVLGTSAQLFGIMLAPLPERTADQIGYRVARLAVGDLSRYGLTKPQWLPFTAKKVPIIDVGLIRELKAGRVAIRPNIARFTATGIVFTDHRAEGFDVAIAATGFRAGLEKWIDAPNVFDQSGAPKFPSGQPTAIPGLYFIGYVYSQRGHLYEANIASRKLARALAQKH